MLTTAVRACNMPTNPTNSPKVVDFSAYKMKMENDQEVKLSNYSPCEQDVVAFLRVLRFLQLKTASEQVEIESNADGITISLTEYASNTGDESDTVDYTTISHKTLVPFPFMLVDLDPSELTVHDSGQNTVELFSDSMATMMTKMQSSRKP